MKKAARRIVEKLRLHGYEAFFAGGWVRDFLLRRRPKDIDIATSALPDEVLRLFPNSRSIGARYGVIQVSLYGRTYEIATFRSDNAYLDGRHPSSVTFSGPEQDALRRDFTINGLFYDPVADRLIDYVRGRNDIQGKLIRTIGNPAERFAEDKLRMLRALRFACSLGFTIVPETWEAIRRLAPGILQVRWERIRDELSGIFAGPDPAAGLDLLHRSGLLMQVLPEVEAMEEDAFNHTRAAMALLHKPSAALAFGTLLHDIGKLQKAGDRAEQGAKIAEEICRRLKMSNEEINRISDLVSAQAEFSEIGSMRESALRKFLTGPNVADRLELYRINCLSGKRSLETYEFCLQKLQQYNREAAVTPLIGGEDLIAMGYSPGPVFKEILQSVEDLQLEGALRTREEAVAHIKSAFPQAGKTNPRA